MRTLLPLAAWMSSLLLCTACPQAGGQNASAATVEVVPADSQVEVGGSRAFSATVKDAAGGVLSNIVVSWSATPPTVATISNTGVALGVGEGLAVITATVGAASGQATLSVNANAPGGGTGSFNLIDAAEASGELSSETALTYKIYAMFRDPRLPAQYQGNDSGLFEMDAFPALNARFDTLTQGTQDLLGPYLRRPADVGSWLDPAGPSATKSRSKLDPFSSVVPLQQRPTCRGESSGWTSVSATVPIKIWYPFASPGAQQKAQLLAAAFDSEIWPELIVRQGLPAPLGDSAGELGCHGGDGRTDVYLVDLGGKGLTVPIGLNNRQAPVYILLSKGLSDADLKSSAAHELMHAIQWAHNTSAAQESYGWLRDATANWAIDAVYPNQNLEHNYADCYLRSIFLSLESRALGFCTRYPNVPRDYGAYLFFQFMDRVLGRASVKAALAGMASFTSSLEAVNAALPGGFIQQWPEFVKRAWNQAPVSANSFATWDSMNDKPEVSPTGSPQDVNPGGSPNIEFPLDLPIPRVAAHYYHFKFPDVNARAVTVLNPNLAAEGTPLSAQAFRRDSGSIWVWEDWTSTAATNHLVKKFCRDMVSERLDELVVVYANAAMYPGFEAPWQPPPRMGANNIGCWKWRGQSAAAVSTAMQSYSNTALQLEFERDPAFAVLNDIGLEVHYRIASGTMAGNFTLPAPVYGACSATGAFSGRSVLEGAGNANGSIVVNTFYVTGLEFMMTSFQRREYVGAGATALMVPNTTVTCPDGTISITFPGGGDWFSTAGPALSTTLPRVNDSGQLAGSQNFTEFGATTTRSWVLGPVRE
ncbi:MAG: Ig-like domain-containing protein [Myxococcaceae bacterium]